MSAAVLVFDPDRPREMRPPVMTPIAILTTPRPARRPVATDAGLDSLRRRLAQLAPEQLVAVAALVDLYFYDRGAS